MQCTCVYNILFHNTKRMYIYVGIVETSEFN